MPFENHHHAACGGRSAATTGVTVTRPRFTGDGCQRLKGITPGHGWPRGPRAAGRHGTVTAARTRSLSGQSLAAEACFAPNFLLPKLRFGYYRSTAGVLQGSVYRDPVRARARAWHRDWHGVMDPRRRPPLPSRIGLLNSGPQAE
jgi:hypothetical protein